MTTPPRSKNQTEHDPPPGAERFWGQFSQAGKGGEDSQAGQSEEKSGNGSGEPASHGHECLEWCPLCRSAELLRHAATPEMAQQVLALQKEAATVLKAFVLAYAERTGDDPFSTKENRSASDQNGSPGNGDGEDLAPKVTDITID